MCLTGGRWRELLSGHISVWKENHSDDAGERGVQEREIVEDSWTDGR